MSGQVDGPSSPRGKIAGRLHDIFDGHINLSDLSGKAPEHVEPHFRTRALAALTLLNEGALTPAVAGAGVTDGGDDDGIDALYIDKARDIVYFVQSKWRTGDNKGIELADFNRFRDGVLGVLALNWTDENKNLHPFKVELEEAFTNIDTRIVMIFAYTTEQNIAGNIQSKIDKFIKEQNSVFADFIELKTFKLKQIAQAAQFQARPENIKVAALLEQWGTVKEPYDALYGSIAALDVVRWYEDHGTRLFAENLRFTIDKSSVNDKIIDTAENQPEHFWYFNNGITAICDTFHKQPIGGNATDKGVFDIKRISVINGAQTIGSLARAKIAGSSLDKARVHIRIISLVNTPDGFSVSVTNANNTQNDLSPVDFVAADATQDRLRKEAADIGLNYTFRRGDSIPEAANGFDIRSATIAAACASGDLRLAVASKRYISGLWENTKKEPYTKLFNNDTTAKYLWLAVRIMRKVDSALAAEATALSGKNKLVAVHGNRFALYYLFEKLKKAGPVGNWDYEKIEPQIDQDVSDLLAKMIPLVNKLYPEAYPGNVFKNNDRQAQLLQEIEAV